MAVLPLTFRRPGISPGILDWLAAPDKGEKTAGTMPRPLALLRALEEGKTEEALALHAGEAGRRWRMRCALAGRTTQARARDAHVLHAIARPSSASERSLLTPSPWTARVPRNRGALFVDG